MIEFRAVAAMGRRVRGHALVAKDGFSARYDLDRVAGVFSRPEHKLAGQSYVGRILVLDAAKGGVATAWMLQEMTARGVMPAALALNRVNPIMVQGAALAEFHNDIRVRCRYHRRGAEWRAGGSRCRSYAPVPEVVGDSMTCVPPPSRKGRGSYWPPPASAYRSSNPRLRSASRIRSRPRNATASFTRLKHCCVQSIAFIPCSCWNSRIVAL